MCFDEVRQAERLSRILFYINWENKMAINKTYEELVESAKELEMEQSETLVELSDRERALVYGE